ncbi:MAG: nucleotidyltransferase [Clostridia bacterium]|nr:nucleotidyltransferase [Clostridia bacterium]
MTLVIMAAGMGSRYGGLKQIDPIGPHGEFIIDYSIYDAVQAGFDKVVFIIKEENLELFRETVGKRVENKVKVEYAFQSVSDLPEGFSFPEGRTKPLGTGHAVWCARKAVEDNFAVINSDDFYGRDAFVQVAKFLRNAERGNFCMAGYILKNTVTENGYVSRGVCLTEGDKLTQVVERTHIEQTEDGIAYLEKNVWTALPEYSLVSMNCWGFTPTIFDSLEKGLKKFLQDELPQNPEKAEFFLPFLVQDEIDAGNCTVDVLETTAKWYGVTYAADRPVMADFLKQATEEGIYPSGLFE